MYNPQPPQRPPTVAITPLPPPAGTVTSAVMVYACVSEHRPAGRRTRSRLNRPCERPIVQRKHLILCRLLVKQLLHFLQLVRHLRRKVVELRVVLGQVVQLPLVIGRGG